jgi:mRNA interferase MazF
MTKQIIRGDVWLVNFGANNNSRIQGSIRPAIVISNDKCNSASPVITVIALTSNIEKFITKRMPTHVFISKDCGLEVDSVALCEQPRSIDKAQLLNKICQVDHETMLDIEKAIKVQLGMPEISLNNQLNNQNKIENNMDINYLKELIVSINQLNLLQKQTNKPIGAKKMLLENFIQYCKKYNKDHKIVFEQIRNTIFGKSAATNTKIYHDDICEVSDISHKCTNEVYC